MTQHAWPPALFELGEKYWQQLLALNPTLSTLCAVDVQRSIEMFSLSDFIAKSCISEPNLLSQLLQQHLAMPFDERALRDELSGTLATQLNDQGAQKVLRVFRRREMVRIAWLELSHEQHVDQSMAQLSALATLLVDCANSWLYAQCVKDFGTPMSAQGEALPLVVIGMGKLGGGELNFSSDIDLIFSFAENGETQGGRRSVANQQFFIRMGQRLIQLLDQRTRDGFVFRVDMRLRPFGESGPLAVSFNAMEDYYQHHGRDWERYAMVKARVLNVQGDNDSYLRQMLKPFVYRRYIDYSAVQALRAMRAMINAEIRRKGLRDNIKLGVGGIREIEFIVQAFQLIRGGREPKLQTRALRQALQELGSQGVLKAKEVAMLDRNYLYLRRVENYLQQFGDEQTQTLPSDDLNRLRLSFLMGFGNDWQGFYAQLQNVHSEVNAFFQQAAGEERQSKLSADNRYLALWHSGADRDAIGQSLSLLACSCRDDNDVLDALYRFFHTVERRQIGQRGRQTLDRLMPTLLEQIFEHEQATLVLPRILLLLEQILSRTAYMELLAENTGALKQLLTLCAGSAMLAQMLANHPLLLDELLDPEQLYNPAPESAYAAQLREFMLRIPLDDDEQQIEALRQFKQIQTLRITAADIVGALPLMKVSDHLTALAEALVSAVVEQAWQQLVARFGKPQHLSGEQRGFAVVGYGKIGGIETGYGSDLDLVFLHNSDEHSETDGARVIDSRQFYLKLAQRIMHLVNTRTNSGILYELDMRLRPSGASGLLVSSLSAFSDYQQGQAWTWEHQALVRARIIYGDDDLSAGFAAVRAQVLGQARELGALKQAVLEMRDKMRAHLSRENAQYFDLKQSKGGMVDIEFLAQYLVLAYAHAHPSLLRYSDNVRIFETACELELLSPAQANALIKTYVSIRDESHRCALQHRSRLVEHEQLNLDLQCVLNTWRAYLLSEAEPNK